MTSRRGMQSDEERRKEADHARLMKTLQGGWRDDPMIRAQIAEAGSSSDVLIALQELTVTQRQIRGCRVNPDRAHLQALQNLVGWTIGGFDTRPPECVQSQKAWDKLMVLVRYRQPADPGNPPRVDMYEYLCETLFNVPMVPVAENITQPVYEDPNGSLVPAQWMQADWDAFRSLRPERPLPCFAPNKYPYQVPEVQTDPKMHAYQRKAQHWILWYFHYPNESITDLPDEIIDRDVRMVFRAELADKKLTCGDYIWYRNPGMSVPDMFHVQVFFLATAQWQTL